MRLNSKWNRRGFLGTMGVIAGAVLAPRKLFSSNRAAAGASTTVSGFGQTGNPYEELGVTTVINCEGTMTMLGGSLPHPELEAVMTMAGQPFRKHSGVGGRRRQTHRADAQVAGWLHRARDLGRRGGDSIRTGGHSHRRQRDLDPAIARPDRDEVGSHHPEIASQSV